MIYRAKDQIRKAAEHAKKQFSLFTKDENKIEEFFSLVDEQTHDLTKHHEEHQNIYPIGQELELITKTILVLKASGQFSFNEISEVISKKRKGFSRQNVKRIYEELQTDYGT